MSWTSSAVSERVHFDANGRDFTIQLTQDAEPIIDRNKRLQTLQQKSDWGRQIAEIPVVILTRWLNEEWDRGNTKIEMFGPEMDVLVDRKLRDPDWRWLRTDK